MKKLCFLLIFILVSCTFTPKTGQELIAKTKETIQKRLGNPVVFRTESPNQIWSYRLGNCSLLIYFDQNDIVQFVDHAGDCP